MSHISHFDTLRAREDADDTRRRQQQGSRNNKRRISFAPDAKAKTKADGDRGATTPFKAQNKKR